MIIYTDHMPDRFDGWTIGPVSLIRPRCRDNAALHAHEAVHRDQFWRNPFRAMCYSFSMSIRQAMEVEAYRAQLTVDTAGLDAFIECLTQNYGLKLTTEDARNLLTAT